MSCRFHFVNFGDEPHAGVITTAWRFEFGAAVARVIVGDAVLQLCNIFPEFNKDSVILIQRVAVSIWYVCMYV